MVETDLGGGNYCSPFRPNIKAVFITMFGWIEAAQLLYLLSFISIRMSPHCDANVLRIRYLTSTADSDAVLIIFDFVSFPGFNF